MTTTIQLTHTADEALARFELISGPGSEDTGTACAETSNAWMAGEAWTDNPECAHKLLRTWTVAANDADDTTPEMRAELVRAGEVGLIDTWWIPDSVAVGCLALAEGEPHYAKTLGALRLIEWWKSDKRRADLRGSDLRGSNLRESNLRGSDLRGSDLRGSDLRGSNLSWSNLSWSNLRGSNLRGSNLRSATWNEYTLWPAGFDIEAAQS